VRTVDADNRTLAATERAESKHAIDISTARAATNSHQPTVRSFTR